MEEQANIETEKRRQTFPNKTKEELDELNKKTEYKTNFFLRIYRVIRDNKDLVALFFVVLCFAIVGYWIARFEFGLSTEQIKLETRDFIEFFGFLLVGLIALIGKLFMVQGNISKTLSKSANKDADNLGNTRKPSI